MLRSRVRRSFTVEIKSKSRQAPSWPELPSTEPVNWAALDPGAETPEPAAAEIVAPAAAAEKPRRILPSLLVAEPEAEAPPPLPEREPPLPRVRRVKVRPAPAAVRPAPAAWSFADLCEAEDAPAATTLPRAPEPEPIAQPASPVAAVARLPKRMRAADPALRPGERWKRRLPRSCR